jgi:hypothetical protein
MDPLQTRLDALEQQMHTVTRRLRWWRGLAGGLLVLAVLTWALPAGQAKDNPSDGGEQGLEQRVSALEDLLKHFSRDGNKVFITGANLHLVNGLGQTACGSEEEPIPDCPNGLGNLIVGYNELREPPPPEEGTDNNGENLNIRTGSHNVVVGSQHNFSRFGGLVVGFQNEISGDFAVVSGGVENTASGFGAAVSGGRFSTASGDRASVSGGSGNEASGDLSSVSDGANNEASGDRASVSGGSQNTASGDLSSVSGGGQNFFTGEGAGNTASGGVSSVNGGTGNTASGDFSSVSGGRNITQDTAFGWSAGSEADEVVEGNFRSP